MRPPIKVDTAAHIETVEPRILERVTLIFTKTLKSAGESTLLINNLRIVAW